MQKISQVVLNLIIINVLVFIAQNMFNPEVTNWGALHYFKSENFKPHQLITNMFMHSTRGFGHLFFNMFALYMFGTMIENYIGSKKFLVFYFICGLGSSLLTQLFVPYSAEMFAKSAVGIKAAADYGVEARVIAETYMNGYSALGASGAIMGVLMAFALLFPDMQLQLLFFPTPIRAKFMIPIFMAIDLFGGIYRVPGDNIGHFAHLGGAIAGYFLIEFWIKKSRSNYY